MFPIITRFSGVARCLITDIKPCTKHGLLANSCRKRSTQQAAPCVRGNTEPPEDGSSENNADTIAPLKTSAHLMTQTCSNRAGKVALAVHFRALAAKLKVGLYLHDWIQTRLPLSFAQETAEEVREMGDLSSRANIVCPKSEDNCLFQEGVMPSAVPSALVRFQWHSSVGVEESSWWGECSEGQENPLDSVAISSLESP